MNCILIGCHFIISQGCPSTGEIILWDTGKIFRESHHNDVMMSTMASQITSITIVYSSVYVSADQRKHQSSALLALVRGIHRRPVNSPRKGPVRRKMFPFDDVIMNPPGTHNTTAWEHSTAKSCAYFMGYILTKRTAYGAYIVSILMTVMAKY